MADALPAALQAIAMPTAATAKTAMPAMPAMPAATADAGADPFAALIAALIPAAPATAVAADPASAPPAIAVAVALPAAVPPSAPTPETAKPAVTLATLPPTPTRLTAKRDEGETPSASDDGAPRDEDDKGSETATTPAPASLPPASLPAPPLPPIMAALIAVAAAPAPEPVAANDTAPPARPAFTPARPATLRVAPPAADPQPQPATDATGQPATAFAAVAAPVTQGAKADTTIANDTNTDTTTAPIATADAAPTIDPAPAPKTSARPIHAIQTGTKGAAAAARDTDRPRAGNERGDNDRETAPIRAIDPAAPAPPGFDHRLRGPAVTAANDTPAAPGSDASLARTLSVARDGQWLDGLARDIAATASGSTLHFRLDPVHLGGLSVAIQHDADGATVRMTADRAETRAMLADAQPRLAAEARAQGLTIKHAQVDGGAGDDRASQTATSSGGTGSQAGGQHASHGRDPAKRIETFASEPGAAGASAQSVGQTPVTDETARYA